MTNIISKKERHKAYMREYNRTHVRERYARLKAEGRCTMCGEPLTDKDTTLNCRFCRAKKKLTNKQQRDKRRADNERT